MCLSTQTIIIIIIMIIKIIIKQLIEYSHTKKKFSEYMHFGIHPDSFGRMTNGKMIRVRLSIQYMHSV